MRKREDSTNSIRLGDLAALAQFIDYVKREREFREKAK
jgi:hypothetical protein